MNYLQDICNIEILLDEQSIPDSDTKVRNWGGFFLFGQTRRRKISNSLCYSNTIKVILSQNECPVKHYEIFILYINN